PGEQARGRTIDLGFAPLRLPGGPRLSVVDAPGHERFVRTMVAGATGIDLFLMVVAADDGVMPQTREHASVLAALGVERGVVAITKSDVAEPELALGEAAELLPGAPAVAVSARTGSGLDALRGALDDVAAQVASRAGDGGGRLRLERPLVAARGDRLVLRSIAPPDTLGGGVVLDPRPRRPLQVTPKPVTQTPSAPAPLGPEALALEQSLRDAGFEPPIES